MFPSKRYFAKAKKTVEEIADMAIKKNSESLLKDIKLLLQTSNDENRKELEKFQDLSKSNHLSLKTDFQNFSGTLHTVKADIQTVKADIQTVKADVQNNEEKRVADVEKVERLIFNMKLGMGGSFEEIMRSALETYLDERKIHHTPVITRKFVDDPTGHVHGRLNDLVELDVYVDEPRIIMECTSHVKKDEFKKIQQLLLKKELLAKSSRDGTCKAILATYSIDKNVQKEIEPLIKSKELTVINAMYDIINKRVFIYNLTENFDIRINEVLLTRLLNQLICKIMKMRDSN